MKDKSPQTTLDIKVPTDPAKIRCVRLNGIVYPVENKGIASIALYVEANETPRLTIDFRAMDLTE